MMEERGAIEARRKNYEGGDEKSEGRIRKGDGKSMKEEL
jgi:hypothetical protein